PSAGLRHGMREEAVEIIRALWAGDTVTYRGKHFDVESAKVWDMPESPPPIGIAVSGPRSCGLADGTPTSWSPSNLERSSARCSTMREAPESHASVRS